MKKSEIINIGKQAADVLKGYTIVKAAIFGSFAKGKQDKSSDIDILIEPGKSISLFQLLKLEKELQKVTKRKIDIVEYSAIKKSIRKNVLKDAIAIL